MKTRLFSLWLLLSVAVGLSAYDFEMDGLCYHITRSTAPYTVEVTGANLTIVKIPDTVTYDGVVYRVTSIREKSFRGRTGITSVTIGNSVTSIGEDAFSGCIGLTSVTIGNSVTSIGRQGFYCCTGITSVTIPNSVTSIGESAFSYCTSLTSVVWNAKSYKDYDNARDAPFYDIRSQITSFTFGEEVKHIPAYLCAQMTNLTSVTIGNSVTSIGKNVFYGCNSLTSVTWNAKAYLDFNGSNTPFYCDVYWDDRYLNFDIRFRITSFTFGDEVKHIPAYLCAQMTNLTSVTIPNSVTSIGDYAFESCTGLTSVTIPNSVTSIGKEAFSGCTGLTSVTIGNSVTSIKEGVFRGCNSLTSVTWNAKAYSDFDNERNTPFCYNVYYGDKSYLNFDIRSQITSFTFGDSVQHIPAYLCAQMTNLTSVTIPNSVTSIGKEAFWYCIGLTSVTIGNSVTSIGSYAFSKCRSLTSVTIPNGVTSIGSNAFSGCKNVETVVFGSGVETIGASAFSGCQSIYEMTIYATKVPTIQENTFAGVGTGATLRVPAGCAKKYKAHPYWGVFNIEEIPSEYTITVTCDPKQGQVTGGGTYTDGSKVSLTATPNDGYVFTQWSDGNKDNPRKVTVTADATYTAEFALQNYVVSATCAPQHGQVTGGGTYPYGSKATLTATPNNGYEFKQWSDGCTANPYSFLVEKDMTIEALFEPTTPIENVVAEEHIAPRKVFRDGQVYILRGGQTYTLTGVEVNL